MVAPIFAVTPQPARALPIVNGKQPPATEGARALPVLFPLDAGNSAVINLDLANYKISFIQAVFIDNSLNGQPVRLAFPQTGQVAAIPKNSQGFIPVLFPGLQLQCEASSTGGVAVPCQFLNIPFDLNVWSSL